MTKINFFMIKVVSKIILIFILLCKIEAKGQNFTVSPNPVTGGNESSKYDITTYSYITNNETSTVKYRWKRIRNVKIKEWKTAVCDIVTCYTPTVDSADFDLNAGQKGPLQGHFYPSNTAGNDTLLVIVFKVSNPAEVDTVHFYASAGPKGILSVTNNLKTITKEVDPASSDSTFFQTTIIDSTAASYFYKIKKVIYNLPSGWTASTMLDTVACTDTTSFQLSINGGISLKGTLRPLGAIGDGSIKIAIYAVDYPLYVDTILFYLRSWPTSIFEAQQNFPKFNIYPVPVSDNLTVELLNNSKLSDLEIYNMLGQKITSAKINSNSDKFNISLKNIPAGKYFIKCKDKTGNVHTKSFIKN